MLQIFHDLRMIQDIFYFYHCQKVLDDTLHFFIYSLSLYIYYFFLFFITFFLVAGLDTGVNTFDLYNVHSRTRWVVSGPEDIGGSGNAAVLLARGKDKPD